MGELRTRPLHINQLELLRCTHIAMRPVRSVEELRHCTDLCTQTLQVTFIAWIPGHAASFLGSEAAITGGAERMSYFKNVRARSSAPAQNDRPTRRSMRSGVRLRFPAGRSRTMLHACA